MASSEAIVEIVVVSKETEVSSKKDRAYEIAEKLGCLGYTREALAIRSACRLIDPYPLDSILWRSVCDYKLTNRNPLLAAEIAKNIRTFNLARALTLIELIKPELFTMKSYKLPIKECLMSANESKFIVMDELFKFGIPKTYQEYLFLCLVKMQKIDSVRYLHGRGIIDINSRPNNYYFLEMAIEVNSLEMVQFLVENGADLLNLSGTADYGSLYSDRFDRLSFFGKAVFEYKWDIANYLLDIMIENNEIIHETQDIMCRLARANNIEMLIKIVTYNKIHNRHVQISSDSFEKYCQYSMPPSNILFLMDNDLAKIPVGILHTVAERFKNLKTVEEEDDLLKVASRLIASGSDANLIVDSRVNFTTLMSALRGNSIRMIRLLLKNSAIKTIIMKNNMGRTILDMATFNKDLEAPPTIKEKRLEIYELIKAYFAVIAIVS